MAHRYEVKDAEGNTISKRASIQFARSDANKHIGATIWECRDSYAEGKRFTWKFPTE